jgi:hypothetical protein
LGFASFWFFLPTVSLAEFSKGQAAVKFLFADFRPDIVSWRRWLSVSYGYGVANGPLE